MVAPSSNSLTTALTEFLLIWRAEEMSFITGVVIENERIKLALQRQYSKTNSLNLFTI